MTSSVYMIRAGEYCKIGKASNPNSRINSFRTGNPFRIHPLGTVTVESDRAALELEGQLHYFGRELGLHHHNEWFTYSPLLELNFAALGDERGQNEDSGWPSHLQTMIGNAYTAGWPSMEDNWLHLALIGGAYGSYAFQFMGPNGLNPDYMNDWESGLLWAGPDQVWLKNGPSAIYHRHSDGRLSVDTFSGESLYFSRDRVARIRDLMTLIDGRDPP
jgi:hypothetical protein